MKHARFALLFAVAAVSAAMAADAPYFGKWKLNPSKSHLTDQTTTFKKLPSGEYRFEESGFAYNFRMDGKEYPMPNGGTTSWKAVGADGFECTNRVNGKVNAIYRGTVKGDTLSWTMIMPQPGGKDITETSTSKRVSGGPGILGTWQDIKVNAAPTGLELTPNGGGLLIKYPEFKAQCAAQFDGKQYPVAGEGAGSKTTMAFRKTGAASFEATTYIEGQAFYIDSFTVSADGKVLTDNGTPASKKEPVKAVYDRQ